MLKKSKLIIGASLIAQAFSCLILALIYMKSKKNLSKTCFALGLAGGIAGFVLLFDEYRKQLANRRAFLDDIDYTDDDYDDFFDDADVDEIDCSIQTEDEEETEA